MPLFQSKNPTVRTETDSSDKVKLLIEMVRGAGKMRGFRLLDG